MDPKVEQYKVTFRKGDGSVGFKFFFKNKDLLEFLSKRPISTVVILLEQYDRETHTFKSFEQ